MRDDVLKIIANASDITNAIVLTHNIDFVFIQSVVLPTLRKCGHPALTVLADHACASESFAHQERIITSLGTRYRVIPVAMHPSFRFHPKAIFLSGQKKATLLVGSGNLTFGGWRENGEIWIHYDSANDGTQPLAAFRNYLRYLLDYIPSKEALEAQLVEAFDPKTREWAKELSEPENLLWKGQDRIPLIEKIGSYIGNDDIEKLYVCTPYFDEEAEALLKIAGKLKAPKINVLVQSRETNLTAEAASKLGKEFNLQGVSFFHTEADDDDGSKNHRREVRLHAKFIAVQRKNKVTVFAGSANCSKAALTIPGHKGNAELVFVTTVELPEFERLFINELENTGAPPDLPAKLEYTSAEDSCKQCIRIRSASMNLGDVRIDYEIDQRTNLTHAEIDGFVVTFVKKSDGSVEIKTTNKSHRVVLVGKCGSEEIRSSVHWIDNEAELAASARIRSLSNAIYQGVSGDNWNIGAWTGVLAELNKHIAYMPPNIARSISRNTPGDDSETKEYTREDVFSDSYCFSLGSSSLGHYYSGSGRIDSLRALLLRWYGVHLHDETDGERPKDEEPPENDPDRPEDDRPEKFPERPAEKQDPPTDKEKRTAIRIIEKIVENFSNPDNLEHRPPELLAADLKIMSALFRSGSEEGWFDNQEFFNSTLKIWLPLFFDTVESNTSGWIEYRYLTATDKKIFIGKFGSIELIAALGAWILSTTDKVESPEHALFHLSSALSVARLPWLWHSGSTTDIAREIEAVLKVTTPSADIDWHKVEAKWKKLVRRGEALYRLESLLKDKSVADCRSIVKQSEVVPGELLWQGSIGFCIAKSRCSRRTDKKENCKVLVLGQKETEKKFSGNYLIPVSGLLESVVSGKDFHSTKVKPVLMEMVEEIRIAYAGIFGDKIETNLFRV